MRLASAEPLLLTSCGCPLAFDLVDADSPRPQPIVGRATYNKWLSRKGEIWYDVSAHIDGRTYNGSICIQAKKKFN